MSLLGPNSIVILGLVLSLLADVALRFPAAVVQAQPEVVHSSGLDGVDFADTQCHPHILGSFGVPPCQCMCPGSTASVQDVGSLLLPLHVLEEGPGLGGCSFGASFRGFLTMDSSGW